MKNHFSLGMILAASTIISTVSYADNIKIVGTIDGYVTSANRTLDASTDSTFGKHILFQRIELSPAAKKYLARQADNLNQSPLTADGADLPNQVQLGMNNIPVLDQGRHGTCVTFAVSGVLDAAIGQDDYISQLCNLELGSSLEKKDSSHYSGWDGSWGDVVLNQISDYGIINMTSQRKDGCAGVYEYPRDTASNKGRPMDVNEFTSRSERIMNQVRYETIATHADAFSEKMSAPGVLRKIKNALNNGHRLSFGTLLDVNVGHNGALGTYKVKNDTWMITPQIRQDAKNGTIEAGHEMIITGYDDNAVVIGPDHTKQVGVLTLRNSWGSHAGDSGTYYLTYAHFKLLTDEVYEVIPTSANKQATSH